MDRTAWIMNLREPFGAALGRELLSRGWNVIGGDPESSAIAGEEANSRQREEAEEAGQQRDSARERALDDGWGGAVSSEESVLSVPKGTGASRVEARVEAQIKTPVKASDKPSSGWTHGRHIGENRDIPTGTGSSGLEDFEGSVGFGPESNARPKSGEWDAAYAQEADHTSFGADPNASNEAGAFVAAETKSGKSEDSGNPISADDADAAQALPEHGRQHVFPLDAGIAGELEEAVRLTNELTDRIDLLVLNAGEIADAASGKASEASADTTDERLRDYETYALTPLRAAESLLPLMDGEDALKRICFISSHAGSISAGETSAPVGRAMAYTALHMQARLLFNDLRREGYTFRLYDPGLIRKPNVGALSEEASPASNAPMTSLSASIGESARFAAGFFANPHAHEDRIVLTGSRGEEWPF